jgi:sugar lactone lactonase YvrE
MRQFRAERATEQTYQLAEGPVWDGVRQHLLWVDIPAGDVHRGELRGSSIVPTAVHHVDTTVSAVVPAPDSRLLVAGHHSVYLVEDAGAPTEVARLVPDDQERRLNDGKCDPAGRFLVGTQPLGSDVHEFLYAVDASRGVEIVDDDLHLSNGLGWSPDGATMYSVDTTPGMLWQRSYDDRTGTRGERRELLHVTDGVPDGMCVDVDGNLWVAIWGAGEVRHFSPSGELLGVVSVPAPHTSCPTFAGADLDIMVISTAADGLSPDDLAAYPDSGALFVADVGVRGLPAAAWSGSADLSDAWPWTVSGRQ